MITFTDSADVALILAIDADRTARRALAEVEPEPEPAVEPSRPRRTRLGNRERRANNAADLAGRMQVPPPRLSPADLDLMVRAEADRASGVRRVEAARVAAERAARERVEVDAFLATYPPAENGTPTHTGTAPAVVPAAAGQGVDGGTGVAVYTSEETSR